jgi:hypothetical protein
MAHDVVYRCADGFWKAAVIQWGRYRVLFVYRVCMADTVQFTGADTWLDVLFYHFELSGGQCAHDAHLFEGFTVFNFYRHECL